MAEERAEGSCLCGDVHFTVELPTRACVHCHCSMCRRNHGAGYVTWFVVPRAQFSYAEGCAEPLRYDSSEHGHRSFCGRCGTSLFCESTRHPDEIDIVLACMNGPIDRAPQLHIYWDDRIDWLPADEELPKLEGDSLSD